MFNNIIVTVRKKFMDARNMGQGNSCPLECEHSEELETRETTLPKSHQMERKQKGEKKQ